VTHPKETVTVVAKNKKDQLLLISIHERKSSNHPIIPIKSRTNKVLRIMTKKFKEGKHGKTSMLKLLKLPLLLLITEVGLSKRKVTKDTPVVDGTDEEDHLSPTEGGDVIDGSDTVGDVVGGDSGGNIESETVGFGGDVSEDGEHGGTSVFEFGGAVFVEFFL
jgi:hypothetical protein